MDGTPPTTAIATFRGLADSIADLFEPVDAAPIERLLSEHAAKRATIERVSAMFTDEQVLDSLGYFIRGNGMSDGYTAERMFLPEHLGKAIKALDADYWSKALAATDVLSSMPASRRDEWHKQIEKFDVPPFTADALRSTLAEHLASRHRYFAERIDGLFRALSPDHKTNIAAGFRSKMILQNVCGEWYRRYARDSIVDLRIIVARFMGRPIEQDYDVHELTGRLIDDARAYHRGEWVEIDGGAIGIRLYANGNCHIRVHDEIAWRLNGVLASVNPGAIPESNRTRPAYTGKRKAKDAPTVDLVMRPLPFAVLRVLSTYSQRAGDLGPNEWEYGYGWGELDKHVRTEVMQVLASIGAVDIDAPSRYAGGRVRFDYTAADVLREIIASGCVPDRKAHQFYPTPPALAARVIELADIGPTDRVLEPSAGQGAIADLLPRDRTVCVEASALHCAVLRAKGLTVWHGDFMAYTPGRPFDRVIMNPPFDRGQWRAHVEHAAEIIAPGGRLVAVLPEVAKAAMRRRQPSGGGDAPIVELSGFACTWSEPIVGAFAGTNIAVVILTAVRL